MYTLPTLRSAPYQYRRPSYTTHGAIVAPTVFTPVLSLVRDRGLAGLGGLTGPPIGRWARPLNRLPGMGNGGASSHRRVILPGRGDQSQAAAPPSRDLCRLGMLGAAGQVLCCAPGQRLALTIADPGDGVACIGPSVDRGPRPPGQVPSL